MKRIAALALSLAFALTFAGCGAGSTVNEPPVSEAEGTESTGIEMPVAAAETAESTDSTDITDSTEGAAANIREDVCELYLQVLEDLWNVDSGLNSEISQIGIDLSELSHLTEAEKDSVMSGFASKHDLPYVVGTFEELCDQGLIDKENLCWKDGLFFSIKTNEDAEWNLPFIKAGDPLPELTSFDARKWRSGLGAYFFSRCAAQKNADGTWSYTVGQEAIA